MTWRWKIDGKSVSAIDIQNRLTIGIILSMPASVRISVSSYRKWLPNAEPQEGHVCTHWATQPFSNLPFGMNHEGRLWSKASLGSLWFGCCPGGLWWALWVCWLNTGVLHTQQDIHQALVPSPASGTKIAPLIIV